MRVGGIVLGLSLGLSALLAGPGDVGAKDCVKAVRSMSDFSIQGDAWKWWQNSTGLYAHDAQPHVGSVLVFKRTGTLGRGHVSLVSAVINNRTIEVDHTWLKSGEIRRGMMVIDVSSNNDWSEVRVWHEPTDQLGQRVYPTYGFVLPSGDAQPSEQTVRLASSRGPLIAPRSIAPASRASGTRTPAKKPEPVTATATPRHKPIPVTLAKTTKAGPKAGKTAQETAKVQPRRQNRQVASK